ncbi:MAG: hypothetical protein J6J77_06725 [Alistipes sp.]|nr:hypothetical protein [Alistipes sp.]
MGWELARASSRIYLCCRNRPLSYRPPKGNTEEKVIKDKYRKTSMQRLYLFVVAYIKSV